MATEVRSYRNRNKRRKNNYVSIFIIVMAIMFFTVDVFFAYIKGVKIRNEQEKQISVLQQNLNVLTKTNKKIQQDIYFSSKEVGIEKSAREMGLVKSGEIQYRVIESNN